MRGFFSISGRCYIKAELLFADVNEKIEGLFPSLESHNGLGVTVEGVAGAETPRDRWVSIDISNAEMSDLDAQNIEEAWLMLIQEVHDPERVCEFTVSTDGETTTHISGQFDLAYKELIARKRQALIDLKASIFAMERERATEKRRFVTLDV